MSSGLQKYNKNRKLDEWVLQVEECRNSGKTVKDWCREQNLSVSTDYLRQEKVYEALKQTNTFYEVSMPEPDVDNHPVATLQYGEYRTEIYRGTDEETIVCILRAIKRC